MGPSEEREAARLAQHLQQLWRGVDVGLKMLSTEPVWLEEAIAPSPLRVLAFTCHTP